MSGTSLRIGVAGASQGTVDLFVLQLTENRRVRTDNDLVFFNQPASPEGAVRLTDGSTVDINLGQVPAEVDMLAVAVSLDDSVPGSLATVPSLGVTVSGVGDPVRAMAGDLSSERAALLVEVYRRAGGWKIRNVSQGWAAGLSAVLREHGIDVAESGSEPRTAPGEEKLSLKKKEKLDLRKREVAKVLLTKQAAAVRARVVLVLDKTGSMGSAYEDKVVHRVVERMVPVAVQLDEDGTLEAYLYANNFLKLPDLRVGELETWPQRFLHMEDMHEGLDYDAIGYTNDELPIIAEVLASAKQSPLPTLVLFFTDGGFVEEDEIAELMVRASHEPVFWQFVGIGEADYGVLEKLDELPGRLVDNAGFFALDDVDKVSDSELYERVLAEFPAWLQAARTAGIIR
ncbi:VWA domain-containing protein [Fodinicola feengrottensis]|uniref:VWA domain-containing protein n=1 Tax=Fodinicola feengrottensis TaxID=435914 RepID=A0ABN2G100_9ACTN